jgi:hypothetical protein
MPPPTSRSGCVMSGVMMSIQADHQRGASGDLARLVVDIGGAIDRGAARREVGGRGQVEDLTLRQHRIERVARLLQQTVRLMADLNAGEHLLMADATARIAIDDLDQFADGVHTITHHMRGHPLGYRHHFAVDHQHAEVVALQERLDDHRARELAGDLVTPAHLLRAHQADRDAAPVAHIERLGDQRVAQFFGGGDGLIGAAHHDVSRHWNAHIAQQFDRQLLIAGRLHGDIAGFAADRGADALLILAPAQLHQAVCIEPNGGDIAATGLIDDRGGGRAERHIHGPLDQRL